MSELKIAKEEKIRAEVIGASQQLFHRYGFQKTTMEDIAKAMGRGKSTLYYYFKSKDEIYEAIVLKEAQDVVARVIAETQKETTASAKLKVYLLTAYQVAREKINLSNVARGEFFQGDSFEINSSSMTEHLKRLNEKSRLAIKSILAQGVDDKEFKENIKDELDVVSSVVLTTLNSVSLSVANNQSYGSVMSDVDLLTVLVDILINGLKR